MNTARYFHYLLTLIIWCNELLFLIISNSLFTDSLHFPYVFTRGLIQLFFSVMNQIKIINQVWLISFIYDIINESLIKLWFGWVKHFSLCFSHVNIGKHYRH